MSELKQGVKIKSIYWGDQCGSIVNYDSPNVKSLTVEMVPGHMASLPWARQVNKDGTVMMHNLFEVESVEFFKEAGPF